LIDFCYLPRRYLSCHQFDPLSKSFEAEAMDDSDECESPGATIMWFGKHEGIRFDELDPDYVHWMMNRGFENTVQPVNVSTYLTL
jgi:hypothetical protein